MDQPLIHHLREMRARINTGEITLDEAAAQIGADPETGLTESGARDLLSRPSAEVERDWLES